MAKFLRLRKTSLSPGCCTGKAVATPALPVVVSKNFFVYNNNSQHDVVLAFVTAGGVVTKTVSVASGANFTIGNAEFPYKLDVQVLNTGNVSSVFFKLDDGPKSVLLILNSEIGHYDILKTSVDFTIDHTLDITFRPATITFQNDTGETVQLQYGYSSDRLYIDMPVPQGFARSDAYFVAPPYVRIVFNRPPGTMVKFTNTTNGQINYFPLDSASAVELSPQDGSIWNIYEYPVILYSY